MTKFSRLELTVPPAVVFLLCTAGIWVCAWFTPEWSFTLPLEEPVSTVLSALGVLFAFAGLASFARARTTTDPMKPQKATTVVTTGIYQYTRNPMYLGLFLFLAALAVKLGNPTAMPFLPAFVAYMNRFQIAPEERILEAQFGDTYTAYKSRVRRWI